MRQILAPYFCDVSILGEKHLTQLAWNVLLKTRNKGFSKENKLQLNSYSTMKSRKDIPIIPLYKISCIVLDH